MYNRDKEASDKIPVGGEVSASPARNGEFHRKAMSLLHLGHDNQETYQSFEVYRKIITIKAGYFDEVPSKRGVEFMPKSISFEKMSAETFDKYYKAILNVISNDLSTAPEEIKAAAEGYY